MTDVDTRTDGRTDERGPIMTEAIRMIRPSERGPLTLAALPENTRAGTSQTVTVCAEPDAAPYGIPCWNLVLRDGTCPEHGTPRNPQRVTVPSAWDAEGNRTMTHSMWRCR